jgi:hypothetical protein
MAKKASKKAKKKRASKPTFKIPPTAAHAEKAGYPEAPAEHTHKDKQRWVMLKQRGNWSFQKAATATAIKPQTICHYDPNTGTWTDCYNVT